MTERRAGLKDRFWSLFFPKEPKKASGLGIMFHLHTDESFQINQRLLSKVLSKERKKLLDDALQETSVSSSISNLNRRLGHDEIDRVIFGRLGRFVDNYVRAEAFRQGGHQPSVVGSGDSGILCAVHEAGVMSLGATMRVVVEGSRALAIARGTCSGAMFSDPEFPLHTSLMRPYLAEFNDTLDGIVFNDPQIPVVGGGKIMTKAAEIRQAIIRHTTEQSSEDAVRVAMRRLGVSQIQEIGLDEVDNTKKYLTIGAIIGGVVLAVVVHNKRQKTKKA
ncbi:hypothetical protein A2964_00745 [Candidatus Daviesbacteria bacterium RIFCSPLOWO2_01_FULL_40_27]|nr:MAG: hypothetical protein A2964_00745 [Candidatus Daviesbacteria bacterium RIFCSPLOWO2_01_FULL_40_27]